MLDMCVHVLGRQYLFQNADRESASTPCSQTLDLGYAPTLVCIASAGRKQHSVDRSRLTRSAGN